MVVRGTVKGEDLRIIYKSPVFPTSSFAYAHDLKPELAEKMVKCFYDFRFPPAMQKEFNGDDRFFPITYKDNWKVVREIAEGSGTPYNKAAYDKETQREAEAAAKKAAEARQESAEQAASRRNNKRPGTHRGRVRALERQGGRRDAGRTLVIRNLRKEYVPGRPVLKDVSVTIAGRGMTAIIGPSGTGKSTLIRCINRLVDPTSGEILFRGQDLAKLRGTDLRQARRRIGMVFQEYNLVERLTVIENLLCGRLGYVPVWRAWLRKFPHEPTSIAPSACSMPSGSAISPPSAPTNCRAASASASASRAR